MKVSDVQWWWPARWLEGRRRLAVVPDHQRVWSQLTPPSSMTSPAATDRAGLNQSAFRADLSATDGPRRRARGELEIHYTALSLTAPEKSRFKYRLEGYDQDWVEADTRRVAYYTNLWPGDYNFRVIACNNDGVLE